ncbi:MAG: dihydropteroate synthase [Gammaproteobacteria bacterium]
MRLRAGNRQLDLSVPVCMGVINLTPDSFSDGSLFAAEPAKTFRVDIDKTLQVAEAMLSDGAAILDIGGESTRPGAEPVSEQQEIERVIPVIEAIKMRLDVCLSVDTSSAAVMAAAIAAGVDIVNDVRALGRENTLQVVAQSAVGICLMHMRVSPATMQDDTEYDDLVVEVRDFLQGRLDSCVNEGIAMDRLLVDPGFGFGKSAQQNFSLLKRLPAIVELGQPVMVGMSRKSMIGAATGRPVDQRLAGGVAAAVLALQGGARIIRSHDVAATMDAIGVHCAFQQA